MNNNQENNHIGFIGIGLMGKPMAINLIKSGFNVIAWNRTIQKAENLREMGAEVANNLLDIAKAEIIITMLEAGPQVAEVINNLMHALKPGTIVIDMSSTRQTEAQDLAKILSENKIHFIDAPVSGGVLGAEAGTLAIMAGGNAEQYERVVDILSAMGKPTLVGPVGCGQLAKLCNQLIVGGTLNIVAEALLLAQAGGADPKAVRTALRGGFAESRILEVHGQRMLDRNFMPGGQVKSQSKDMENILVAAKEANIALPVASLVAQNYKELVDVVPHADQSAILLSVEKMNTGARLGQSKDQLP